METKTEYHKGIEYHLYKHPVLEVLHQNCGEWDLEIDLSPFSITHSFKATGILIEDHARKIAHSMITMIRDLVKKDISLDDEPWKLQMGHQVYDYCVKCSIQLGSNPIIVEGGGLDAKVVQETVWLNILQNKKNYSRW